MYAECKPLDTEATKARRVACEKFATSVLKEEADDYFASLRKECKSDEEKQKCRETVAKFNKLAGNAVELAQDPRPLLALCRHWDRYDELSRYFFGDRLDKISSIGLINSGYPMAQNVKYRCNDARRTTHHIAITRFQVRIPCVGLFWLLTVLTRPGCAGERPCHIAPARGRGQRAVREAPDQGASGAAAYRGDSSRPGRRVRDQVRPEGPERRAAGL